MGKPYQEELAQLGEVHDWAAGVDTYVLESFVDRAKSMPLYAVGSGGSLTAAAFAAMLHRWTTNVARYVTPQMLFWEPTRAGCATLLMSAGGRNPEILDAFRICGYPTGVVCASDNNPLMEAARTSNRHVHGARPPTGHDGFLATNTLLATCVWLAKAYGRRDGSFCEYDLSWFRLLEDGFGKEVARESTDAVGRKNLLVLGDAWSWPAAVDAESKFHESGLCAAQITDWRNFAHGRHQWIAANMDDTAVLALVTPQSEGLANDTLELLPGDVPVVRLETWRSGPAGTLNLLVKVMHLVGEFGRAANIDPGRPGVSDFGRRIHHMNDPR